MEVWWFCSGVLAVAFCARRWRRHGAAEQVVNCAIWWRHGEDDREWHRWMVRLWLWEKNSRWRKVQRWWCEGAAVMVAVTVWRWWREGVASREVAERSREEDGVAVRGGRKT
ncbi:hypothetical protein DEO72_LG5g978 [Vigna unguiculata]|uniref:Uncharacterized protein n=1 Tax=Vigna unguiculata TaxID=3917 RepID=A0A4D6LV19_VIGUN|nr:hypothetical protein DEO72_LG5g978 [Vigna unguiculata]